LNVEQVAPKGERGHRLFIYLFMPPSIGCNWRLSPWWTNGDLVLDADADAEADLDPWMPCAMP